MENNNYSGQQVQYQQPQQMGQPGYQFPQQYQIPPVDPNYSETVKGFLTKAIVACAISSLPVGSMIAIGMASKNRKDLLEYLDKSGLHTVRMKVCSCLSRAGRYSGIGFTIFWAIYLFYILISFSAVIIAIITQMNVN